MSPYVTNDLRTERTLNHHVGFGPPGVGLKLRRPSASAVRKAVSNEPSCRFAPRRRSRDLIGPGRRSAGPWRTRSCGKPAVWTGLATWSGFGRYSVTRTPGKIILLVALRPVQKGTSSVSNGRPFAIKSTPVFASTAAEVLRSVSQ